MAEVSGATTPQFLADSQRSLDGLSQDFDDFLNLLTTQLRNQDPLDPMDSSEFTNQLVQFSQVEQSIRTNSHLEDLVLLQNQSLTSIALSYIGKNIEVPGSEFDYEGSGDYEFSYLLADSASDVTVSILDEDGQVVHTASGEKTAGKHAFTWDGLNDQENPVDAGTYTILIDATDEEGEQVSTQTQITLLVDGVQASDEQLLLTSGDLYIPFVNVISVSLPPES